MSFQFEFNDLEKRNIKKKIDKREYDRIPTRSGNQYLESYFYI
jgi:hypothetical protein